MDKFLTLCTLALILSLSSFSQSSRLSGKVINSRNEAVPAASIYVSGIDKAFAADLEGRFNVELKIGETYIITVTSAGFNMKMVEDVTVTAGNNSELVILMEDKTLEEVVVRSSVRRESTNVLLNFQKNNTSLSSGIAADFIRRTPDRNTSEVLKRVSGTSIQDNKYVIIRGLSDRYNQALINNAQLPSSEPDKKAFSFDVIPSAMIENIIINKTATPDLTGEFAGGLVQINTKDIPSRNQLSVGFSVGYNTQSTFKDFVSNARNKTDFIGFDDGTRKLPDAVPNVSSYRSMSDAEKIQVSKEFNGNGYNEVVSKAAPITTLNLTWSNTRRFKNDARFGTIVSVFHRRSMTILDDVERGRYEFVRSPIFSGGETQNKYSVNAGVLANFTYINGKNKISFKNLFNQLFEDTYFNRNLDNTGRLQDVSLRGSFLNQRSLYSGQLEGEHLLTKSGLKFNWNGNGSFNYRAQPDFRTAQYVRSSNAPNTPFQLDDDDTRRFFSELKDYSVGANGSLSMPFQLADHKQLVKVGGSMLLRFRDFNSRVFRYKPASPNVDIAIPFNEAFLTDNIKAEGLFLDEQTQNTDQYYGGSALNAGYLMFDNKFGEGLRIVWGLRAEYFNQVLTTRDLSLKRIVVDSEKWDLLPSLNLTYSFNNQHQVRVSGSRTIARPEFREIAPFQFFNYEQIWGIAGNTELQRSSIINGDLRYEFYPRSGEIVSFGVLYKNFNDPIELRMDPGSNGDRWLFAYSNADQATLYGAEMEFRKRLDFIAEGLKNFTVSGNVTVLESRVTLNTLGAGGQSIDQDRPLYGQSPYLINAGIQYSNEVWNATALYNRIGPRLSLVGDPNGAGFFDIYENPRNLIDLQVSKKVFGTRGEVKLTVSDLLNNRYIFYDNPSDKPGYSYSDGDRINMAYRPGTTVTIGFLYNFDLGK